MLILKAQHILMEYGERTLIDADDLRIHSGDRIALVGVNGCGKTTLMRILSGDLMPDSGTITTHVPVAYIPQLDEPDSREILDRQRKAWGIPLDAHSGGELTRLKIARALGRESGLLLCDEPTANLDVQGIEQFEAALRRYEGALLLISHDRELLDNQCNKVWELKDGAIHHYKGGWSDYRHQKQLELKKAQDEYDKYSETKARLEHALSNRGRKAATMERPSRMGLSEARLHRGEIRQRQGKASAVAAGVRKRLDRLEAKEQPKADKRPKMKGSSASTYTANYGLKVKDLHYAYGQNEVLRGVNFTLRKYEKSAICGDNGSGKTTLFRAIMEESQGVTIAPGASIAYFDQRHDALDKDMTVLDNVMATSALDQSEARTILARLMLPRDDVFKPCHVLSGGELCKVMLAKLLCMQPAILLLDEPTNYLDVYALEALEEMIVDFPGTVLYISHDRAFTKHTAQRILHLKDGRLEKDDKPKPKKKDEAQRMVLELRRDKLIAQISSPPQGVSPDDLDEELNDILAKLKELNA